MKTIFQIQTVDRGRFGDAERWSSDDLGGDPNFDTFAEAQAAIDSLVRLGGDWERANLRIVEVRRADTHTPGPWRWRTTLITEPEYAREIRTAPDATGHSELVAMIPDADGDHINADARLVASAPELLDTLRMVTYCLARHEQQHGVGTDSAAVQRALDVIAKATGGAA